MTTINTQPLSQSPGFLSFPVLVGLWTGQFRFAFFIPFTTHDKDRIGGEETNQQISPTDYDSIRLDWLWDAFHPKLCQCTVKKKTPFRWCFQEFFHRLESIKHEIMNRFPLLIPFEDCKLKTSLFPVRPPSPSPVLIWQIWPTLVSSSSSKRPKPCAKP